MARLQLILINLVDSALDVDGSKLALVVGLELRADIILVNGVAPPGELLFAVAAFGRGHEPSSVSSGACPIRLVLLYLLHPRWEDKLRKVEQVYREVVKGPIA